MESNFLIPLRVGELKKFFDAYSLKIIDDLLLTSTYFQPPCVDETQQLPIHIPKEHIEQFVVQAIGAKACGAGSYPIDVINEKERFGADVKMLSCKIRNGRLTSSVSGETSLAQKFKEENLDKLFNEKSYDEIKNIWINILNEKYRPLTEKKITNLFYFFILRAENEFFLTGCKLNLEKINNICLGEKLTSNSIFLKGVIDNNYGNAKIYKAKKRLELRLNPSSWQNEHSIKFAHKQTSPAINLRALQSDRYSNYWIDRLSNFKKLIIGINN